MQSFNDSRSYALFVDVPRTWERLQERQRDLRYRLGEEEGGKYGVSTGQLAGRKAATAQSAGLVSTGVTSMPWVIHEKHYHHYIKKDVNWQRSAGEGVISLVSHSNTCIRYSSSLRVNTGSAQTETWHQRFKMLPWFNLILTSYNVNMLIYYVLISTCAFLFLCIGKISSNSDKK